MAKTTKTPAAATTDVSKPETKKDRVLALLRRNGGASLNEITDATNWLPHTARAMLTGFRKKGFAIAKQKVGGATRYSVEAEPAA